MSYLNKARKIIKREMKLSGVSQNLLAKKSGVSQPTISTFLNDLIDPAEEVVSKLLEAVGYKLDVKRDITRG